MRVALYLLTLAVSSDAVLKGKKKEQVRPTWGQMAVGAMGFMQSASGHLQTASSASSTSWPANSCLDGVCEVPINQEMAKLRAMMTGNMQDEFYKFAVQQGRDYVNPNLSTIDGSLPDDQLPCKRGMEDQCYKAFYNFQKSVRQAHDLNEHSLEKHRGNPSAAAVFGVNKFADISDEDFTAIFKGLKMDDEMPRSMFKKWDASKIPATKNTDEKSIDWREHGIITPVKDQLHCGSCWAHSVVETVESNAIRDGIVDKSFRGSPEELVQCDLTDSGCNGGSPMFGFYYLGNHGLETEADYPYTSGDGSRGSCKLDESEGKVKTGEIWMFENEKDMQEYMFKGGPISIAVDALKWKTYKSGIFPADQCTGQLDHAVQAVGLNLEAEEPYWIVRNSWNTNWGEDGYIRIPYGQGACGLDKMAMYADVKKPDAKIKINV